MHVLGLADPFDLALEGLEDPIKIQPYVICSLSHDLNLGEHFLQRYKARLKFEGNKVTFNLNNHSLELVSRSKPLIRNSKDQRFISVMEKIKSVEILLPLYLNLILIVLKLMILHSW